MAGSFYGVGWFTHSPRPEKSFPALPLNGIDDVSLNFGTT